MDYSVVVPVHNERENVPELYEELTQVLEQSSRQGEVIWVDDGSDDGTAQWLDENRDENQTVVRLRTNYGQSIALNAGTNHARGEVVVFIDGDGQQDPADISRLLDKMEEPGVDLVSGWRKQRKDSLLFRIIPSMLANLLISLVTGVKLHDYGCTLKAYQAELIEKIPLYGEFHRFLPAMAAWYGARVTEVEVNHRPRTSGKSHYGLGRIPAVFLDLIVVKFLLDYGFRPIRIFGSVCLWLLGLSLVSGGYLGYLRIYYNQSLSDHALTTITVVLGLMAMQCLILGLLGEQFSRFYDRTLGHEEYRVESRSTPDQHS